jgi:4-hydroxybenzoate polyprenyltransferase
MLENNQQGTVPRRAVVPKFKAYLSLIKPVTSVSIMLAIPFTALLYGELYGPSGVGFLSANLEPVALASAVAFLTHSGTQSLNMSEDAHIDRQTDHKSDRPIPSGVISRDEARSLAWATVLVGVGLAFAVNTAFGAYTIVLVALGVWYNLDPVRTKKRLWINLVWQAVSRGLLLYPAAFAVFGDPLSPVAWGMGVVAFLLVLSLQNTADFSDVDMDGAYGIQTPAVYHGLRRLVKIMTVLSVLVFATLLALIYLGVVPNFWSLGLLAVPIYWSLWKLWTGPESVSGVGDNHASWYVYYLCLASLYIVPPIQLILFP